MYLTVRKFSGVTNREEVFKRVEQDLVPQLRELPGFVAYYAVEFEDGDVGPVVIFETKENADRSTEKALKWVKENLAEFLPNEPTDYRGEVLFHTAKTQSIGKTA